MDITLADKALEDPIIQDLVKQSIKPYILLNHSGLYNSCNFFSQVLYCTQCNELGAPYGCEKNCNSPLSCDALDLKLKNKGILSFGASSLVGYAIDQYINNQHEQDRQKRELTIENMANGK
jgi:hypothetical protein